MKCTIPEISWHNRDPVLSVDIQPTPISSTTDGKGNLTRLASGGSDSHVLIWYVHNTDDAVQLELASDLTNHQRAVNVVRWSPSGEILASADDENFIILWHLKKDSDEKEKYNVFDDEVTKNLETWMIYKTLRGHLQDVYDLAWSPNSEELLSGSVDNTAIVWKAGKTNTRANRERHILDDHKGFVQGVAWDPKNEYLATLSTDRYFRLYRWNEKAKTYRVCNRISKSKYPVDDSSPLYEKTFRLFHDDTLQTFYRRICFSPDGELIFVPSGVMEDLSNGAAGAKMKNTTYIFTRHNLRAPAVVLPAMDQYTVVVRCCPELFTLRPHDENVRPMIALPYRVIFAVATKKSVYFYDTQQKIPFGVISNIHYARLTDLTWSSDGSVLIVSSVDGFCTLVTFENGELGDFYKPPATDEMDVDVDDDNSVDLDMEIANSKESNSEREKPKLGEIFKTTQLNAGESAKTADNKKNVVDKDGTAIQLKIPETIIATTDQFESPEYKCKPATPIAIRRVPRTSTSTPSTSIPNTPTSTSTRKSTTPVGRSGQKSKTLRHGVSSGPPEQEEALDSWPKPIDNSQTAKTSVADDFTAIVTENTEDLRLVYEGESELADIKPTTDDIRINSVPIDLDTVTPESKSAKTPRRVELRTLSTPKAKKKIF